MNDSEGVPHFFIYGEPPREVHPWFVHVENVSDKNHIHRGKVKSHRHGQLYQLMLWTHGEGTYFLDAEIIPFRAPAFGLIPAGVVHGFNAPPPADALVASLSNDFMADISNRMEGAGPGLLAEPMMASLTEHEAEALDLRGRFACIEREFASMSLGWIEAIAAHVKLLLLSAARLKAARSSAEGEGRAGSELAGRFLALLEQHYVEGWTAPTYARILGTTPYLLNRIFVARFGCTAASAIASRRLTEAKRLLFYTDRSVSEIAFDLGYSSPGYFCRLFRVRTGQSPGLWRRERVGRMAAT